MGLRLVGRCVIEVEALFGVPETAAEVRGTEGEEAGAAAIPVAVAFAIAVEEVPAALEAGASSA